jgi:hypothetical protein
MLCEPSCLLCEFCVIAIAQNAQSKHEGSQSLIVVKLIIRNNKGHYLIPLTCV